MKFAADIPNYLRHEIFGGFFASNRASGYKFPKHILVKLSAFLKFFKATEQFFPFEFSKPDVFKIKER